MAVLLTGVGSSGWIVIKRRSEPFESRPWLPLRLNNSYEIAWRCSRSRLSTARAVSRVTHYVHRSHRNWLAR